MTINLIVSIKSVRSVQCYNSQVYDNFSKTNNNIQLPSCFNEHSVYDFHSTVLFRQHECRMSIQYGTVPISNHFFFLECVLNIVIYYYPATQ